MTLIIFIIGFAIWINSLIFSMRWQSKHGVPPATVNFRSVLLTHFERFLLGVTCIAGYLFGGIHFVWLIVGGAFLFMTVTGLVSVLFFHSTGGLKQFENPSKGLRRYTLGKQARALF